MIHPVENDFLEMFGLEPVLVEPDLGLVAYRIGAGKGVQVEFSFSLVMRSFQVVTSVDEVVVSVVSSEGVGSIQLFERNGKAGLEVAFNSRGGESKAVLVMEPEVSLMWSTLVDG